MTRVQYAGVPGSLPSPILAAVPGSGTTGTQGSWYCFYLQRSRAGHSFASSASVTLSDGDGLDVQIPASAVPSSPNNGTHVLEHVIMLSRTNSLDQAAIVATWPGYEDDESTLRPLPLTIRLLNDENFVLEGTVGTNADLPSTGLVHGAKRRVTTFYEDGDIIISKSGRIFTWNHFTSRWDIDLDQLFNVSVTSMLLTGGANEDVSSLDLNSVVFPEYTAEEGAIAPEVGFWIVNDGSVAIPAGRRVGVIVSMGGEDISSSPGIVGGILLRFRGYVNVETGVIDPNADDGNLMAGISYNDIDTPFPYPGPIRPFVLHKDLQPGEAYYLTVQATMSYSQMTGRRPYDGAVMSITPSLGEQVGIYFAAAPIFGSIILSGEGSRRILPGASLTAIAAPGSGVIETQGGGYVFTEVPQSEVYFVEPDNPSQNVYINISGGCAVDNGSQPPATALRAVIGTANGVGKPAYKALMLLTGGAQAIQVDIDLPKTIRADYPDVIAGQEATLNAAYVVIYLHDYGDDTTYRFRIPISPGQETFSYQCDTTTDIYSGAGAPSSAIAPAPDFGLFEIDPDDVTLSIVADGTVFPSEPFNIYVGLEWELSVTSISHASPPCMVESPLTYAEMQAALAYWAEAVETVEELRSLPSDKVVNGQARRVLASQSTWQYWTVATGTDTGTEETEFASAGGLAGGWSKDQSNRMWGYEGLPPTTFGRIGDISFDSSYPETGNVYRKEANGTWQLLTNIRGPQGIAQMAYYAQGDFFHRADGTPMEISIETGGQEAFSINHDVFISDEDHGYHGYYKVVSRAFNPSRISVVWANGPSDNPPPSGTAYSAYDTRITPTGAIGQDGRLYAVTAQDFEQPAVDGLVTVNLAAEQSEIFPRPSQLTITNDSALFGTYEVTSVPSSSSIEVKSITGTGGAFPGTTMPAGMRVIPTGGRGATGNDGTADAGGALSLTHATAPNAETDRTKVYSPVDGRIKLVDAEGNGWELVRSPAGRKTIYSANAIIRPTDGLRLEVDATSDVTLTLPLHTNQPIPVDTEYTGILTSAVVLTIAAESGVTLNSPDDIRVIARQWQGFLLIKRDLDLWWFTPLGGGVGSDAPVAQTVWKWLLSGDGSNGNRPVSAAFNGEYWLAGIFVDNGGQDLGPYVYKSIDDRQTWTQITIQHDPSGYVPPDQGEGNLSTLLWLTSTSEWFILTWDLFVDGSGLEDRMYYGLRSPDGENWTADDPSEYPTEFRGQSGWASNGSVIMFPVGSDQGLTDDSLGFIDGSQAANTPELQGRIDGNAFGDTILAQAGGLSSPGTSRELGYQAGAIQAKADAIVAAGDRLKGEDWGDDYSSAYTGAANTKFGDSDSDWWFKYPYWQGYLNGYGGQYSYTYEEHYWRNVYEYLLGFYPVHFGLTGKNPNRLGYDRYTHTTSLDSGRTWTPSYMTPFPGGKGDPVIRSSQGRWISVPREMEIATYGDNGGPVNIGGVFISEDGVNWVSKSFDIESFPTHENADDFFQDSADWWGDTIIVALASGKLMRSGNNGDSWALISGLPFENPDFGFGDRFHIYGAEDKRWLICRGNNGLESDLWASKDDGITWVAANQGEDTDVYGLRDQFVNGPGFAYGQPANEFDSFSCVALFKDGEGEAATPEPPANNNFADAQSIASVPHASTFFTIYSSGETGEPSHASLGGGGEDSLSVWYTINPASTGTYRLRAEADFDVSIAVYTGSSVSALTAIASNNEMASGNPYIEVPMTAGTDYYIAIDGAGESRGVGSLGITEAATVANDNFSDAIEITGSSYSITTSSVGSSGEVDEPSHGNGAAYGDYESRSLWWKFNAPDNGFLNAIIQSSDFNTVMSLYRGISVNNLSTVADGDDSTGQTAFDIPLASGVDYYIAVDGDSGETGTFQLDVSFTPAAIPGNAEFANAFVMTDSYSLTTQNVGAYGEVGEPRHGGRGPGGEFSRSLWWSYTPTVDGLAEINTNGSTFDTVLVVYTGNSVDALTEVQSDTDSGTGANSAIDNLYLTAGVQYLIAVDGEYFAFDGEVGTVQFSFEFEPGAPPANDSFANAEVITGTSYAASGINNFFATGEVGEPNHAGRGLGGVNAKSMWWKYVPAADGSIILSASGTTSGFDPVVSIHVGSSVDSLTELAGDVGFAFFAMTAGSEYYIAIDGDAGQTGFFRFSMRYLQA